MTRKEYITIADWAAISLITPLQITSLSHALATQNANFNPRTFEAHIIAKRKTLIHPEQRKFVGVI